ncbi:MAG TPA: hypothetical protein VF782_01290 [Allosphingosinicella sp.]|jgi:hypothetical protein
MGYYLRVLSPDERAVAAGILTEAAAGFGCRITGGTPSGDWSFFEVVNRSGEIPCTVERNVVEKGSIGEEEISAFKEEIADCLPRAGAEWLRAYLENVRTIYVIQVFDEVYSDDGWSAVRGIMEAIRDVAGGIIQADGEGFSNEEGYQILWQFSDHVDGEWWMAVLHGSRWEKFKMDLGNKAHRSAFKAGEIPVGVERA